MLTYKSWFRDMKAANRHARREGSEIVEFESGEDAYKAGRSAVSTNGVFVTFENPNADLRVIGRNFKAERVNASETTMPSLGAAYRLTGMKGARYLACRNVNRPELLFVVPEDLRLSNPFERTWLTDKDGTLKENR